MEPALRPLITKLEQFTKLSKEDKRALTNAISDIKKYGPREEIIAEGTRPENVHLVIQGWAIRYKNLADGGRPIMAFLIPGDLCDLHIALLGQMDHAIGTLSAAKIAFIPREKIGGLLNNNGNLARALWWATLVDEAILREWLVSMTHRSADQRVGHFLCEMLLRTRGVGLTRDDSFELPLTQDELADTLGMTLVHMNRTLKALRGRGLITSERKRMMINDVPSLMAFAGFDPTYLHQQAEQAPSATDR